MWLPGVLCLVGRFWHVVVELDGFLEDMLSCFDIVEQATDVVLLVQGRHVVLDSSVSKQFSLSSPTKG